MKFCGGGEKLTIKTTDNQLYQFINNFPNHPKEIKVKLCQQQLLLLSTFTGVGNKQQQFNLILYFTEIKNSSPCFPRSYFAKPEKKIYQNISLILTVQFCFDFPSEKLQLCVQRLADSIYYPKFGREPNCQRREI